MRFCNSRWWSLDRWPCTVQNWSGEPRSMDANSTAFHSTALCAYHSACKSLMLQSLHSFYVINGVCQTWKPYIGLHKCLPRGGDAAVAGRDGQPQWYCQSCRGANILTLWDGCLTAWRPDSCYHPSFYDERWMRWWPQRPDLENAKLYHHNGGGKPKSDNPKAYLAKDADLIWPLVLKVWICRKRRGRSNKKPMASAQVDSFSQKSITCRSKSHKKK